MPHPFPLVLWPTEERGHSGLFSVGAEKNGATKGRGTNGDILNNSSDSTMSLFPDEGTAGGRVQGRGDVPHADGREGRAAPRLHPEARAGGQGHRLSRGVSGRPKAGAAGQPGSPEKGSIMA